MVSENSNKNLDMSSSMLGNTPFLVNVHCHENFVMIMLFLEG